MKILTVLKAFVNADDRSMVTLHPSLLCVCPRAADTESPTQSRSHSRTSDPLHLCTDQDLKESRLLRMRGAMEFHRAR